MTWRDIEGWFDFAELYDQAVAEASDGDTFVEIGVYKGRSLAYMADAIKRSGKRIDLYGVDLFNESTRASVDETLRACGANGTTQLIVCDSARAAEIFADGGVRFAFIDADHSTEAVRRDIAAWRPKIRAGGILAGHDRLRDSVNRAVREAFGNYQTSGPEAWWVRL